MLPPTRRPPLIIAALALSLVLLLGAASVGAWRATGTGPQVQVPMFYDAHYLFQRAWTQAQAAPGVPPYAPLTLTPGNFASQPFTPQADRLRIIAFRAAGQAGSRLEVTVSGAGRTWRTELIPPPGGPDGTEWIHLQLPAAVDARGEPFLLTLRALGAPVILDTVGGDRLGGSLRLNEFDRPGNLVLHTYSHGFAGSWWFEALSEQLLPATFQLRVQQYKPQPLKPLFPLLLSATVLLSLAALGLAAPRRSGRSTNFAATAIVGLTLAFLLWQAVTHRWLLHPDVAPLTAAAGETQQAPDPGDARLFLDLTQALWTANREPEPRFVATTPDGGIVVPGSSALVYDVVLPPDTTLVLQVVGESVTQTASVLWRGESVWAGTPPVTASIDLSRFGGQAGKLELATTSADEGATLVWHAPQLVTGAEWLAAESDAASPVQVRFGDVLDFLGFTPNDTGVTLHWRGLRPIETDLTFFVHHLSASGDLLAAFDRPPLYGSYPTTMWQPGDVIADRFDLPPLGPGETIAIGVYDPVTGLRLPAVSVAGGERLPNDAAILDLPQGSSE